MMASLMTILAVAIRADTDQALKAWYASNNHQYFQDELPTDVVITHNLHDDRFQAVTFYENDYYHIVFNPKYNQSGKVERMNLLHESCHILIAVEKTEEFETHGKRWQACMHRLADQGAFEDLW
jgi:hypothetical protein